MCIAIFKPRGASIPFEHLVEGQKHNPDGCGFSWVENGRVQIYKTMSFEEWCVKYKEVLDRLGEVDMLIHFRITSRGKTTEEMCHPFMVGDNTCIIHNGTISSIKTTETANGDSDTAVLARDILSNLPDRWYENRAITRLLEEFIGWSKVCTMVPTPENGPNTADVYILNEKQGHWEGDIWYSNKSYISYTANLNKNKGTTENYSSSDSYYKSTANTNLQTRFWGDSCDGCFKDFKYSEMTYCEGDLFCSKCLTKKRKEAADKEKNKVIYLPEQKPVVHRPCACCTELTKKDEMFFLQLEFITDIESSPDIVLPLNKTYIIVTAYDGSICHTWLCEKCYMRMMDANSDEFLSIITVECISSPADGKDNITDDDYVHII